MARERNNERKKYRKKQEIAKEIGKEKIWEWNAKGIHRKRSITKERVKERYK